MTKNEILEALKNLTTDERIEVAETALRLMREAIEEKHRLQTEADKQLAAAVEAAIPLYMPGGPLYDLWSSDSEDYYESSDKVDAHA